jgi:hypothetical protein
LPATKVGIQIQTLVRLAYKLCYFLHFHPIPNADTTFAPETSAPYLDLDAFALSFSFEQLLQEVDALLRN